MDAVQEAGTRAGRGWAGLGLWLGAQDMDVERFRQGVKVDSGVLCLEGPCAQVHMAVFVKLVELRVRQVGGVAQRGNEPLE